MKPRAIPKTGAALGLLGTMQAKREAHRFAVTHAQGMTLVPLEGEADASAVIRTEDYERLTSRRSGGPQLTRARWFLEDGEVRALSRCEGRNMQEFSYSVAALVMGAKDGETMQMQDPRILTPGSILVC